MHKKTKIILATIASIELAIFVVMILTKSLKEYFYEEWFWVMGAVGISGILYAARTEIKNLKNQ